MAGFKVVHLANMTMLRPALRKLQREVYAEVLNALVDTARFGHGKAVQKTKQEDAVASTTYLNAWEVKKTPEGAVLGNSAYHSYFAEVGRKRGKAPPLDAILEWIRHKNFSLRRMQTVTDVRARRRTRRASSAGKRRASRKRERIVRTFAFAIQQLIAKRGTKGRYILRGLLPAINKKALSGLRSGVKKAIADHNP